MLDTIKTRFSIRDLEHLSGVKAHTIRIWEKRYKLLEPERTNSNIRFYTIDGLRKLLNTSWLIKQGYKISKVAEMSQDEVYLTVRESSTRHSSRDHAMNQLKLAMLSFDEIQFNQVVDQLEAEMGFRDIFQNVFVDFLDSVGIWWVTDVIRPAHEHFVSNLVRQKLFAQIDKTVKLGEFDDSEVYVLFTPINEIHDLGLLYAHYELLLRGKRSIFLGQSVPVNDLTLVEKGEAIHKYICSTTIRPEREDVVSYVHEIYNKLIDGRDDELVMFGPSVKENPDLPTLERTSFYPNLSEYLKAL